MSRLFSGVKKMFNRKEQMNNIVFMVFDSCRFDAYQAASTPNLDRIGMAQKRYSYASWTSPSHYTFLMGMIPHLSPKGVFASEVYREEFTTWSQRLNVEDVEFGKFVPQLSLPYFLKNQGYRTEGIVSLPVLNPMTNLSVHFDRYELAPSHNDLRAILEGSTEKRNAEGKITRRGFDALQFDNDKPGFFFINTGETHYPYILPGETADDLPHISGVHGVFKHLDEFLKNPSEVLENKKQDEFFTPQQFRAFYEKQIACVEHCDKVVGDFMNRCPANTYFMIMSDHGELFGEEGYFGHGPIFHEKVFEVFYLEGLLP